MRSCLILRLNSIILLACVLPLYAAEGKPKDEASQPKDAAAATKDIWEEVSFESEQEIDLTDSRLQRMLEEIRQSDPEKAKQMEKMLKEDPGQFAQMVRAEIRNALKPKAKPSDASQPAEKTTEWQEELQKRHDAFMHWFLREYAADHAELIKVRDAEPEKYVQRVMDMMTIYEPIQRAQRYNPALAAVMKQDIELQKQRDTLLLQIRKAVAEEQHRLMKELETLVAARFDIIVQKKELQYESLRKRLDKLEMQLDQQALELESLKKNKAQTVEDHLRELMSRSETISW
jgi:hypothetical protein